MLKPINKKEVRQAASILVDYWKTRGMKYSINWAKDYIEKGHKTEIKKDQFFVIKENDNIIGTISAIIYESNVAEIRDFTIIPKFRNKGLGKKALLDILKLLKKQKVRKVYALTFPRYIKQLKRLKFRQEGFLRSHFKQKENLAFMSRFQ